MMPNRRPALADMPTWPRLLSPEQAAAYCGVARNTFVERFGIKPIDLDCGRRVLYDRAVIDRALDKVSGIVGADDDGWADYVNGED